MKVLGRPKKVVVQPEVMNPRTIAYLRVSTDAQDLDKNKSDILSLANEKGFIGQVEFVEERISGKTPWKERKIKEILDTLGKGDHLIVSELSRLGRSMLEIMEILSISKEKGIHVYAVKGNWALNGMQSELLAMVFSMAAEIEHDLIRSRTREALKALKERGIKLGRPKGIGKSRLDQYQPEIVALLRNGSSVLRCTALRLHSGQSASLHQEAQLRHNTNISRQRRRKEMTAIERLLWEEEVKAFEKLMRKYKTSAMRNIEFFEVDDGILVKIRLVYPGDESETEVERIFPDGEEMLVGVEEIFKILDEFPDARIPSLVVEVDNEEYERVQRIKQTMGNN